MSAVSTLSHYSDTLSFSIICALMRISFFIVLKIFVDSDDQSSQTRHFRKSNLQTARRVHARLVSQDLWISGIDLNRQFSLFFAITVCRKLRRHHRTRWATINPVPIVGDAKRSSDDRVTAVRKNGHLNAHENMNRDAEGRVAKREKKNKLLLTKSPLVSTENKK